MNKKITSVALAFTLAVAAPVKANLINFDLTPARVFAAETTQTQAEKELAAAQKELSDAQTALTTAEGELAKARETYNNDKTDANAKAVLDKQEAVEAAKTKVEEAQAKVDKAQAAVDKEKAAAAAEKAKAELKSSIDKAEGKVAVDLSAYTDASVKALKDALAEAKTVYAKADATAEQLTAAKTKLDSASNSLVKKSTVPVTKTVTITRNYGTRVYASDLNNSLPSGARVKNPNNILVSNLTTKSTGTVTVVENGVDVTYNYIIYVATNSFTLNRPTVYSDRVTGRTEPYASVRLYDRNNNRLATANADRYGDYTIYYNFGYNTGGYNGGYYNNGIAPSNASTTYVSGRTTAYTQVEAYNNGQYLGWARTDSNGYYTINHPYVSNPNQTVVYVNGYNNGYNNGYYNNLSNFYLQAESNGRYSEKYYLNNAYTNINYNYATAAKVTQANPGTNVVKGNGVSSNATVTIYDSNNVYLGRTTAAFNGNFEVSLNRNLVAGETIKVTTSVNGYNDNTVSYKVSGTTTSAYNYTVTLNIGSRTLTTVKDGKTTTTTMDTEAYIKDGRTMLPIRFVAQALGYNVTWNEATRTAAFSDGKKLVIINIDSRDYYVDGVKNTFVVNPEIKDSRTMLPISEIGRALGMTHGNKGENKNIEWDATNRQVKIQLTK